MENSQIFIIKAGKIESMKWLEYLFEYAADETTTPRGVAPRMHLRCSECEAHHSGYYEKETCGQDECQSKFCDVWSWGIRGNNPYCLERGITWEEGRNKIIAGMEEYAYEDDQHTWYDTREEAEEVLSEMSPEERARFYSA